MPIECALINGVIHTVVAGCVTDEELLSYYTRPFFRQYQGLWRELVDGRLVKDMSVSAHGQRQLAEFTTANAARLCGGRVAMLASDDVTYGMFRMWEMQREGLGFEVHVFRDFEAALAWLEQLSVDNRTIGPSVARSHE